MRGNKSTSAKYCDHNGGLVCVGGLPYADMQAFRKTTPTLV